MGLFNKKKDENNSIYLTDLGTIDKINSNRMYRVRVQDNVLLLEQLKERTFKDIVEKTYKIPVENILYTNICDEDDILIKSLKTSFIIDKEKYFFPEKYFYITTSMLL